MSIPLIQVDAFTNQPFTGNPAAVCILTEPASDDWMQKVAAEMNLSETAFLYPKDDSFNLRWFTPTLEVDLCGHATLASAHVLWELGYLNPQETAKFSTRSGLLTAIRQDKWIELNFPATPPEPASLPPNLAEALGVNLKSVAKNKFDYLVEVNSEQTLRQMQPDFALLKTVPVRGIIVTSLPDSEEYDFVSRFFAPAAGVNEDPVTGSAHCSLGPFWAERLNKTQFVAYQASARGGIVRVKLQENRVCLGGQAVTVLRGELT
ncbi:PhzF family phenazine biosynthesis protein [Ancylothrix sp. C2]|uniref:PhzF family phenazine biosynthesis protein n=1 Tax=Ancylothrix sp. D3o TaxID=2953691 RepID=UPI0021BA9E94|nr:PhzF family phenazine biosynthesis protein [Ancylothrix sp. D3o]MCT7949254.1 PhzF family phenazine biosynthesis protein [Ancylothrix sp. D3o]